MWAAVDWPKSLQMLIVCNSCKEYKEGSFEMFEEANTPTLVSDEALLDFTFNPLTKNKVKDSSW